MVSFNSDEKVATLHCVDSIATPPGSQRSATVVFDAASDYNIIFFSVLSQVDSFTCVQTTKFFWWGIPTKLSYVICQSFPQQAIWKRCLRNSFFGCRLFQ